MNMAISWTFTVNGASAPFVADLDGLIPFWSTAADAILSLGLHACYLETSESHSLTACPKSYWVYTLTASAFSMREE
jgi:hypothetical protein